MYTNLSGLIFKILSIDLLSSPFLGGSTIITSETIFLLLIKSSKIISVSPAINSVLLTLLIFAFSFASSIACSTISTP